jgi:hypothetical protein
MDPGAPIAFKKRSRTRLRSPLGAPRVWWSAGISLVLQITRRFKRCFDEAAGRATSYIEKLSNIKRSRHIPICSRCGMAIESWPKQATRQQIKESRTSDSAEAARLCRVLPFPTKTSSG